MLKLKRIVAVALLALSALAAPANAQSLTPGCSSPAPAYGVVWTASQWIICLSSLQAQLGYTPLNVAGGSMSGPLTVAPSTTTAAPLTYQPGSAPSSPNSGDTWFTSAGLFYRAGGVSIGPLASTVSPSFSSPTFTGTVTFPDASTWTTTGSKGAVNMWIGAATDAGGTQKLQVTGSGYFSQGLSVGLTTATTGGVIVADASSSSSANSVVMDFSGGGRILSLGGTSSTYSTLNLIQLHSDGSGSRTVLGFDTNGNATLAANLTLSGSGTLTVPGTASLGTTSTDYVQAHGGSTGGTITTNGGTLTVGSGGGATTTLGDTSVVLGAAGYSNCAVLGTAIGGGISCGGAPSGYITYNDNVTANQLAATGNLYCMNTGSAALTLTLPASPGNGAYVAYSDCGGNFSVHNLTIAGNGANIMYNSGNMTVSTPYLGGILRYSSGKTSWILSPL